MADPGSSNQTEGPQQGQKQMEGPGTGASSGSGAAGSKQDTGAGYGTGSGSKMRNAPAVGGAADTSSSASDPGREGSQNG